MVPYNTKFGITFGTNYKATIRWLLKTKKGIRNFKSIQGIPLKNIYNFDLPRFYATPYFYENMLCKKFTLNPTTFVYNIFFLSAKQRI